MYRAAVSFCDPKKLVKNFLSTYDLSSFNKIYVVGWGKASGNLAAGVEEFLETNIEEGLVLSNEDLDGRIKIRKVPHPLPDDRTIMLTDRVEDIVKKVEPIDLLICLVSGGGSAMLCDPRIPLEELNEAVTRLMVSGATIQELNAFRRSVSRVKGGRLGAKCRGQILNLIISDVIDGGPWDIASGPTVEDWSGMNGADIAEKYRLPENIIERLDDTRPVFESDSYILADNTMAMKAAFSEGKRLGLDVGAREQSYTGDVEETAMMLLAEAQDHDYYIAGGESTVVVVGAGTGGRNQHLCLSLHDEQCDCFSAGTDGIDGNSDAAGAFLDEGSRAPDWKKFYGSYDSASFFKRSNSQLITGPTGTNVCDLTIIRSK